MTTSGGIARSSLPGIHCFKFGVRTQGSKLPEDYATAFLLYFAHQAAMAQLVEHPIRNRKVPGSIPGGGSEVRIELS